MCIRDRYNHPHIGNARPAVTWDVIRRYLTYVGYKVTLVQNFTDVDDKIINKANAEGTDWKTISDRYIDAYFKVIDALHVRRADVYPRVSDHMDDIIHMVEKLIENGHAYQLDHDVYYDISTFKPYCKLSGRKVEDMLAGARVTVNTDKKNPGDFALWKGAKPGEPAWDSPWGKGCLLYTSMYLKEIGAVSLLTADEEVTLAKAIEAGDREEATPEEKAKGEAARKALSRCV